jgi:catechol 2,3-dioxygenase-like lactoylglutathione lyase family enzyme
MIGSASLLVNLKAPDLDRAVEFYEQLGLTTIGRRSLMPGHEDVLLTAGDTTICIEHGEGGKLSFELISLEVEDVEAVVALLRERGITPEEYDLPSIKTVDGVASFGSTKAAWLKDPAGNLVGIITRYRGTRASG